MRNEAGRVHNILVIIFARIKFVGSHNKKVQSGDCRF